MTERVRIEHEFDCSEQTFWKIFLDDRYNQELFAGHLKFPRWEVTKSVDSEKELERVVSVEPYVGDLPPAIKKVLGESIAYKEAGRLDKERQRYFVKVVPGRMGDKFLVEGEQFTEPLEDGKRCKRVFLAKIEVKIFGLAGIIEKRIAADLTRSYDIGAKFTNRYIHDNGLS